MKTPMEHDRQDLALIEKTLVTAGIRDVGLEAIEGDRELLARTAPVLLDQGLIEQLKSRRIRTQVLNVASEASGSELLLVRLLAGLRPKIEAEDAPSLPEDPSDEEFHAYLEDVKKRPPDAASFAWTLAETLRRRANPAIYEDLVAIMEDRRFGRARQMIPYGLARIKSRKEETARVLIGQLDDELVTSQVLDVLGKLKVAEAIPAIQPFVESPIPLVERNAVKALKKLNALETKPVKAPTNVPSKKSASEFSLPDDFEEASADFEIEQVPELLEQVASLVEGLSSDERKRIEDHMLEMEVDDEDVFDLMVRFQGEKTGIRIRIFMDDVDHPDVCFYTSNRLAREIDQLLETLAE